MSAKPATVAEYLASVPPAAEPMLSELRQLVHTLAPQAAESVSYDMLAYKVNGKPLVYLAGWKKHCAIYGLEGGTIKFPLASALPTERLAALLGSRLGSLQAPA